MPVRRNDQRLDRVASTLGVSRTNLLTAPPADLSRNVIVIDGAPDQFELWAKLGSKPDRSRRLIKIANILETSKARDGGP